MLSPYRSTLQNGVDLMLRPTSCSTNTLTKSTKVTEKTSDLNEWSSYFGKFLNQQATKPVVKV